MPQGSEEKHVKRRRLQNACDCCRKKKIRCDSSEKPNQPCTNCVTFKSECTHSRTKGSDNASAQSSKTAQEYVAKILSTSTIYIPSNDPTVSHERLVEIAKYARQLEETIASLRREMRALSKSSKSTSSIPSLTPGAEGRGSPVYLNEPGSNLVRSPPKTLVRSLEGGIGNKFLKTALKHFYGNNSCPPVIRRPGFWGTQPWQRIVTVDPPRQLFPEDDLLKSLVAIYFEEINPLLGILHSPSFHQSISDGLHLHDPHFGAVVLVVCALGSRYSDDPRVFLDRDSELSRGWKWFRQVQAFCTTFSPEHSLHQLQLICLSINFLNCTGIPVREQCWVLAGLGIRFAHAAGAHRRSGYRDIDPVTAELYKRAFWILVVQDTMMSSFSGRSSMAQPPDFDLDLPLACDDEYMNAIQPDGQLDGSVFLVIFLQLVTIFRRIQEAVYPANGQIYSQDVVVELDSALNSWLDGIPPHLRWDPHQQNQTFLNQSAALYATYYHAQILVHRPFIPTPGKEPMPDTKFPSLAICANAARSCGHVLEVQTRRGRPLHHPQLVIVVFDCAVVLLLNVWAVGGGPKFRTPEDFNRATADVQICARVLRLYEQIWPLAGRKYDIISTMLSVGKYISDAASLKRPHTERDASFPSVSKVVQIPPEGSPIAESSTASVAQPGLGPERSTDHLYSLPLRSDELGRLPIYDPFHYEFTFHYQPHTDLSASSEMQPEFLHPVDPGTGSVFETQDAFRMRNGEEMQLSSTPFDPSDYGWSSRSSFVESHELQSWPDWSAYLASTDGLNQ
ncbi:fungal-specific transcription factor domain-containing protein [Mycena capillaripes]|nr:fungal-specific transcription factor domain-containing protein [Mycena capillaripes]